MPPRSSQQAAWKRPAEVREAVPEAAPIELPAAQVLPDPPAAHCGATFAPPAGESVQQMPPIPAVAVGGPVAGAHTSVSVLGKSVAPAPGAMLGAASDV